MSIPNWVSNDVYGGFVGTGLGSGGYIGFLWSHLSFIPATMQTSAIVTVCGAFAGFLGDEFFKSRYRSIRARAGVGIVAAVFSAALFVTDVSYVIWATKQGAVEGFPTYVEYAILFATTGAWSVACSVGGRSIWKRIFAS